MTEDYVTVDGRPGTSSGGGIGGALVGGLGLIGSAGGAVLDAGGAVLDTAQNIGGSVVDTAVNIGGNVLDTAVDFGSDVIDFGTGAVGTVVDTVVSVWDATLGGLFGGD